MTIRYWASLCLSLFILSPAYAAPTSADTDHLRIGLVSERGSSAAGDRAMLGLYLQHDTNWHTYWLNPGDSGLVTKLRWDLPEGITADQPNWPHPHRFEIADIVNFGYADTLMIPVALQIGSDVAPGEYPISVKASWLICEVECIPGRAELGLVLNVGEAGALVTQWQAAFDEARAAAPVDVAWGARFDIQDRQVVVEIDGGSAWRSAGQVELYPEIPKVLTNALPRRKDVDGDTWRYVYEVSDFYSEAPAELPIVLVSEGATPAAMRVMAQPAELIAAAQIGGKSAALAKDSTAASVDSDGEINLWGALLLALAGGFVLNLMPCVFPVLSLKALTLKQDPHLKRHGVLYTAGVVLSFVALAAVLLALRGAGQALGWGFQLQSPGLIAALALLFFAMGLSLSGVISFGERLMGLGQNLAQGESDRAAFMTGVLAAVVASPCTAPFMGSALGYALTQSAPLALLVFAALGLGLALPFLAISFIPGLASFMPKPGAWMESFKQFLAFPLYATVVWLLWVYGIQTGINAMAILAMCLVGVAMALWALERAKSSHWRGMWGLRALAVASLLASGLAVYWAPAEQANAATPANAHYEAWSPERLDELTALGTPVFVNMTAAWCITCLANEKATLSTDAVRAAMNEAGVVYLKGDWTSQDSKITHYLESFGRSGVPLYVLYREGAEPEVLPQLLTPDLVIFAINPG